MAGVNRWYGIGNMTADPKMSQGDNVDKDRCEFSIAINKPGQDSEPTYLDFVTWGKLAGQVADYGRKGRLVFCDGELEVRKWQTSEGENRKQFRIKAYVVRFLDRRDDRDEDDGRRRSRDDEPRRQRRDRDDEPRRRDRNDEPRQRDHNDEPREEAPRRSRDQASDFDDLPF